MENLEILVNKTQTINIILYMNSISKVKIFCIRLSVKKKFFQKIFFSFFIKL